MVNILTQTAPVEISFWDSPGYDEGVAVAGRNVYLDDGVVKCYNLHKYFMHI